MVVGDITRGIISACNRGVARAPTRATIGEPGSGPGGGLCIYPGSRLGLALYSLKYFPSGPYRVLLPVVVLVPMICLPVTPAVYLGTGHGRSSSTELGQSSLYSFIVERGK